MDADHWNSLISKAKKGHRLSLARLVSNIEDRAPGLANLIAQIFPKTGHARIIGVTGPPGAGKSTFTDQLIRLLRARDERVGVLAVDPSSPFSGGAVLGDRVRMEDHFEDPLVYIRSFGTRGKHGGLSHCVREVALLLDALDYDTIIVETAGVGQTELDVLTLAQSIVVILVPESGDVVQVLKAGLMEIADVFVINKSDRPEAEQLSREVIGLVHMAPESSWDVPVHLTQAVKGKGVDLVLKSLDDHAKILKESGEMLARRRRFLEGELTSIIAESTEQKLREWMQSAQGAAALQSLMSGKVDPYTLAQMFLGNRAESP